MKLDLGKFTLNYEDAGAENYKVSFTDLKNLKRGYDALVSPLFQIRFSSQQKPAFLDGFGKMIYLPGTDKSGDKDVLLVPKRYIDEVQASIAYFNDGLIRPERYKDFVARTSNKTYYIFDGYHCYNTGCKESTIYYLDVIPPGKHLLVSRETISKEGAERIHALQKNLKEEDRFTIHHTNGMLQIKFPEFWKTQSNYRLGWALLKIRQEIRPDELINGGRSVSLKRIEKYLKDFEDGGHTLKADSYKNWSSSANWIYFSAQTCEIDKFFAK